MVPPLPGEPFLGSVPFSSVPSTHFATGPDDDRALALSFFALAPVALTMTAAIAARTTIRPVSRHRRPERDAELNLIYSFPSLVVRDEMDAICRGVLALAWRTMLHFLHKISRTNTDLMPWISSVFRCEDLACAACAGRLGLKPLALL